MIIIEHMMFIFQYVSPCFHGHRPCRKSPTSGAVLGLVSHDATALRAGGEVKHPWFLYGQCGNMGETWKNYLKSHLLLVKYGPNMVQIWSNSPLFDMFSNLSRLAAWQLRVISIGTLTPSGFVPAKLRQRHRSYCRNLLEGWAEFRKAHCHGNHSPRRNAILGYVCGWFPWEN